uniref:PHD-type domain-containing protein n=1 Tax=Plectus sambesii TaxID=2011161 RepID=A0A914XKU5_9BILA
STDQHLLAHCDTCAKHYHLACLDPPLTRMPKKTAQYGWECSKCADDSESDDKSVELGVPNVEENDGPRKLRQRSSLTAPKRAADEIALENAIAASYKRKRGRPSKSSAAGDSSAGLASPATKRSKPPKLTKYTKQDTTDGEDDSTNDVSITSDDPHELVDEKIITVKTTKEPKTRRMQYPTTRLNDAVASVLKGRMNIKQAAERFNVPRSTVQRRITLSREEHKRRASSMGGSGSDQDKKPLKADLNGSASGDELADENIDVGRNPTPPPPNKDDEVDVDSVSDNCSDSMKLVRRRRRKGAEVIVVEDLNLS